MQYFVSGSFFLNIIGDIHSGFAFNNSFFFVFVIWREHTDERGKGEWQIMDICKVSIAIHE